MTRSRRWALRGDPLPVGEGSDAGTWTTRLLHAGEGEGVAFAEANGERRTASGEWRTLRPRIRRRLLLPRIRGRRRGSHDLRRLCLRRGGGDRGVDLACGGA